MQRTLSFCRDLPEFGWQAEILSAHPRAFPSQGHEQLADIPAQLNVKRAFALDAAKDLSVAGRYLRITASPDRWANWQLWAVPAAMAMIKQQRPQVIWATYPIATSLLIAHTLHKKTGIPWVADFRDPMICNTLPEDPSIRKTFGKVEKQSVESCQRAITTTHSHRQLLQERYPLIENARWQVVANGYDEPIFKEVEENLPAKQKNRKITLLHSGTLYTGQENRDPRPFFSAIAKLRQEQRLDPDTIEIIFRATGQDQEIQGIIDSAGVDDMVQIKPTLAYRDAVEEMFLVDGLLLLQGRNYNYQVPAKLFEYLRTRRPLLALTDQEGDSARIMREAGVTTIAPMHDEKIIARSFMQTITNIKTENSSPSTQTSLEHLSRRARAKELAQVLDQLGEDN